MEFYELDDVLRKLRNDCCYHIQQLFQEQAPVLESLFNKDKQERETDNVSVNQELELYKTWYRAKHDDVKNYLGSMVTTLNSIKDVLNSSEEQDNIKKEILENIESVLSTIPKAVQTDTVNSQIIQELKNENSKLEQKNKDLFNTVVGLKAQVATLENSIELKNKELEEKQQYIEQCEQYKQQIEQLLTEQRRVLQTFGN